MSVFEHSRWLVFNQNQHPYRHSLTEFAYANPLVPDATNVEDAINYIIAVLYPNYIGTFATTAALPVSSSANDYAIVTDDGDGKSAGYVWQTINAGGRWIKRYDVDWSLESILAETINRTQYQYVMKFGMSDRDPDAVTLTGIDEGQHIYGGDTDSGHLTLHANSGSSASTGFVQVADHFRPQVDSTYTLGTNAVRWSNFFTDSATSGTLTMTGGSITDSSGSITFGSANLTSSGQISGGTGVFTTSVTVAADLVLASGSITSVSGAISFGNENLSTTGSITGTTGVFTTSATIAADLVLASGSITSASGAITFGNENLTTTGDFTATSIYATLGLAIGPLAGNQMTLVDGSITDESGAIDFDNENLSTTGTFSAGNGTFTRVDADNIRLDGNVLSTTDTNGDLTVTPNGTGAVITSALIKPAADNTLDLGLTTKRFNDLFLGGTISDGTNSIAIANLLTFRAANGSSVGDSLFWDGSKWVASAPDTEINHPTISGLTTGDAGHTQFAMLAGRAGGQAIQGGTAASELLTLESTAHATKGTVQTKDSFLPFTTASFSASWAGADLGGASNYFRHVYTKGEHFGFRLENIAAPANSAQNIGRMIYDSGVVKVDTGGAWSALVNSITDQTLAGIKTWSGNGLFTAKVGIGTGPITPNVELDVFGAWASRRSDVASASSITQLATATSFVKITGALATTVLGLGSGFDGKRVIVHNGSSGSLTIKHQDAGASAADRVITPTAADLVVLTNRSTELVYDSNQSRWVVASSGAGGGSYTTTALQNVGASGSISTTTYDGFQFRRVQGSGNPQTASSTPFGTGGGWTDGTVITLIGQDATKALTILNNDAAKGALLNGDAVLSANSILTVIYDSTADRWIELYRVNC